MKWSRQVRTPDDFASATCPPGFDMIVHVRTNFRKRDHVFYWASLPQSLEDAARKGLSSERRASGPDHANQGVAGVGQYGWCTIRLRSPRPYTDSETGRPVHRQIHMRRAKRGTRRGWVAKIHTTVLNPSKRLSRTLQIKYSRTRDPRVPSMWLKSNEIGDVHSRNHGGGAHGNSVAVAPVVARSREHAAKLMAEGRVSIFLQRKLTT